MIDFRMVEWATGGHGVDGRECPAPRVSPDPERIP
jgi:hypothetical protein